MLYIVPSCLSVSVCCVLVLILIPIFSLAIQFFQYYRTCVTNPPSGKVFRFSKGGFVFLSEGVVCFFDFFPKSSLVFLISPLNSIVRYIIVPTFDFKILILWTEIFEIYFRFLDKYVEFYCKKRNISVLLILKL